MGSIDLRRRAGREQQPMCRKGARLGAAFAVLLAAAAGACGPTQTFTLTREADRKLGEARERGADKDDRAVLAGTFENVPLKGKSPLYYYVKAATYLELARREESYSNFQEAEAYAREAIQNARLALRVAETLSGGEPKGGGKKKSSAKKAAQEDEGEGDDW